MVKKIRAFIKSWLPERLFRLVLFMWHSKYNPVQMYRQWQLRGFISERYVDISILSDNFSLLINPRNGLIDEYIYKYKYWDKELSELIINELGEGDVFLDIGANIGFFSILASRVVGYGGKVLSIEPMPRLVAQLKKSIHKNNISNVTIFQSACGESKGDAVLSASSKNVGGASLVTLQNPDETVNVSVDTVDNLMLNTIKISFIKIDVEGFELEVLFGAKNTIKRDLPIILVEFSPSFYADRGKKSNSKEILRFLSTLGYTIHSVQDGRLISDYDHFIYSLENSGEQRDLLCKV